MGSYGYFVLCVAVLDNKPRAKCSIAEMTEKSKKTCKISFSMQQDVNHSELPCQKKQQSEQPTRTADQPRVIHTRR